MMMTMVHRQNRRVLLVHRAHPRAVVFGANLSPSTTTSRTTPGRRTKTNHRNIKKVGIMTSMKPAVIYVMVVASVGRVMATDGLL